MGSNPIPRINPEDPDGWDVDRYKTECAYRPLYTRRMMGGGMYVEKRNTALPSVF